MKELIDLSAKERLYICGNGKKLKSMYNENRKSKGYPQTYKVYGCEGCSGCNKKAECLYKFKNGRDDDKNKVMKINHNWEYLKEESNKNIQSHEGIVNRQIRSIQTESAFGNMKENDNLRRFSYR